MSAASSTQNPPIPTDVIDNENQVIQANNAWQNMVNSTLQKAEQKLQDEIGVMESLNPMIACQYAMLVLGQAGTCCMIENAGVPSTEMGENSAIGNMLNSIQSNVETLEQGAASYTPGNPTPAESSAGESVYLQLNYLQTVFEGATDPSSQYYGFCSPSMANSMLTPIDAMLGAITNPDGPTTGSYVACQIMGTYQNYEKDPTGPDAVAVNNWNSNFASAQSQVSGNSSQLNQELSYGLNESKQFFAGLEQQMKGQNTLAMAEIQNENVQ